MRDKKEQGAFTIVTTGTTRTRALVFLGLVLLAMAPALYAIAHPFLTAALLASMLAIALEPTRDRLVARIGRPALSTAIVTVTCVLTLGGLIAGAGFAVSGELSSAYDTVNRRSVEEGGWPALATHTVDKVVNTVAGRLPIDPEVVRREMLSRLTTSTGALLDAVGSALGGITSGLVNGLLVMLFLYFFLQYGAGWVAYGARLVPLEAASTERLLRALRDSAVANVSGVLVVAVGQGVLLSLGFWLVGLRAPLLWGAIGGVMSLVPVLGPLVVWGPVAAGLLITGDYTRALILATWGALVVGSFDNVARPFVVGAREKQHPMLVGLAAIGGTFAFGPLGILLGPILVSLCAAVIREFVRQMANGETSS